MTDRTDFDRLLDARLYLALSTADLEGRPWTSPVFFARVDDDRLYWVSSAEARHSLNIAVRPAVSAAVFDSTVPVGGAEAAYVDAEAAPALADDTDAALAAMNARLPEGRGLTADDLQPAGPLTLYRADIAHRYLLVRGGDPDHGNVLDMTVEV